MLANLKRRIVRSACAVALLGVMTPVAAVVAAAAPAAAIVSSGPNVLILDDTVSGGASSQEALAATAAGYNPVIVDQATWNGMTQAQFATYRAIVIGDPTCGYSVGPASQNLLWTNAVMANPSNRVIVGTDPVFHYYPAPGYDTRNSIIKGGIDFAGRVAGATGVYLDLSCSGSGPLTDSITNAISTTGGFHWEDSPCSGNEAIVAQAGPTANVHDADLSGWFCSSHEDAATFPTDYTPLVISTDAPTRSYCATDVDPQSAQYNQPVCGAPYVLVHGTAIVITGDITLTPRTAVNFVGTSHTVTTHVTSGGSPLSGQAVTFTVTDGPDSGATGSAVTGPTGDATFTYTNNGTSGTDSIVASFTDGAGRLHQSSPVIKRWVNSRCYDQTIVRDGTGRAIRYTMHVLDNNGLHTLSSVPSKQKNATVAITGFTPDTTSETSVSIDKVDLSKPASFLITYTEPATPSINRYCSSGPVSF